MRYSDEQKKKNILAKLVRRKRVGEKYIYKSKTFSGIPDHERGNLDALLDEMHQEGLIKYHKGKKGISIHRRHKDKVKELLEDRVPDYFWQNF